MGSATGVARAGAHRVANVAKSAGTLGGSQEFLGASWVRVLLDATPERHRYRVARRLLALSPHYIYVHTEYGDKAWPRALEIEAELERNRRSRAALVRDVISPRVGPQSVVLDYGSGPGYAAAATADIARAVYAADVSAGVVRCAEILNSRPNLRYVSIDDGRMEHVDDATVDVTYSFAVLQHVTDADAQRALGEIARVTRSGGTLVLHIVIDHPTWRTEQEWFADRSVLGRLHARFALQCFNRGREQVTSMVSDAGFRDISLTASSAVTDVDDDIAHGQILIAVRA